MAGLEQARTIFDQGGIGMILVGMPGIEMKNIWLAISSSTPTLALSTSSVRCRRARFVNCWSATGRHWGVKLPGDAIDTVAAASIFRITGGNFRLLDRLLTQVERILEINALPSVTKEVVEAARENLVIGQS